MTSLMPDTKPETPLTDHEAFDWSAVARGEAPPMPVEVVYAGFARGLETRLAAAERELAALRADGQRMDWLVETLPIPMLEMLNDHYDNMDDKTVREAIDAAARLPSGEGR